MNYQLNFVSDNVIKGKAYPALARHKATPYTAEWKQFVQHWPYTVPVELFEHLYNHDVGYRLYDFNENNYPKGSYYAIGLGFLTLELIILICCQTKYFCSTSWAN